MLPLLETVIGFVAIMLVLSLLVKSLASMVKGHVDYYSANLKAEVERLIRGTIGKTLEQCYEKAPWLKDVQWQRLGDEFLERKNIEWLLSEIVDTPKDLTPEKLKEWVEAWLKEKRTYLEARLRVHQANVSYAFEMRTKNLSLVAGLVLCLGLNINAFTIWDTLYNDQAVRAKFASPEAVQAVEKLAEEKEKELEEKERQLTEAKAAATPQSGSAAAGKTPEELEKQREDLKKDRDRFLEDLAHFRGEVGFGMGRIWTQGPPQDKDKAREKAARPVAETETEKKKEEEREWQSEWKFFGYEFFGSLLTGLLVSVGAPYWHDLLRALGNLRGWGKGGGTAGTGPGGQTAGAGGGSSAGSSD